MIRRRIFLSAAALIGTPWAHLRAQASASAITPELIAAAKAEKKVAHYTSDDLTIASRVGKLFEQKYPGISFQLERSGAERNYQRISQEYASDIHAVDVITSSDLSYIVSWKQSGILSAYVPQEVTSWPAAGRDPDGFYAKPFYTLMVPGYSTRLVKPEDAPKTWTDLLDPKWKGKIVKAHPGYSGTIMTGTYALSRALGWGFYERLAKQGVMQVQSAIDPPHRVAQGERAIMADASENTSVRVQEAGGTLAIFYPPEGVPVVPIATAVMTKAPHPNAARLLAHFIMSPEVQQIYVDGGARSFSPTVNIPANRTPDAQIKLLHSDPAEVARETENIRKLYTRYFAI